MAQGNRVSKKTLNEKMKTLPLPVQEHSKRCKMIAGFLLERIMTEDWFLDAKLNGDYIASAVFFHDIGKVSLPRENLYAEHNVTKAKKAIYRSHVEAGVALIEKTCGVTLSDFAPTRFEAYLLAAVTEHHESADGCGFPNRSVSEEISATGKITAIADAVDNLFFVGNAAEGDVEVLTDKLAAMAGVELDAFLLGVMLADRTAFTDFIQYIANRHKAKRKTDNYGLQLHFRRVFNIIENEPRELIAEFIINDPFYGVVRPEVYLPVASLSAQAPRLTLMMMERLCLMLDRAREKGGTLLPVSLHVDANCFAAKRFAAEMIHLLQKYEIREDLICLVVDERGLMELEEEVNYADLFSILRDGGFRMAISCMGEGSTLLGELDTLPVDYLYIDAAYTRRMSTNANTFGVASGVLEIARNLHLSIVFLGCDTHAIERTLLRMHVRLAAGELYGEPLRENEAVSLLVKDGGGGV